MFELYPTYEPGRASTSLRTLSAGIQHSDTSEISFQRAGALSELRSANLYFSQESSKGRSWKHFLGALAVLAVGVLCAIATVFTAGAFAAAGLSTLTAFLTAGALITALGAVAVNELYQRSDLFKSFVDDCVPWLKGLAESIIHVVKEVGAGVERVLKTTKRVLNATLNTVGSLADAVSTGSKFVKYLPMIIAGGVALWLLK